MSGSVHNDLATWAGRARVRGQSTITIDIKTAELAADKIVALSNRVMDLEHQLRLAPTQPQSNGE